MTVEVEIGTTNEELSITEASLEFRLSEAFIRQAVRTHQLASIPHRWGLRVRREDVAEFASSLLAKPRLQSARAVRVSSSALPKLRSRQQGKAVRETQVLNIAAELVEVSISRVHQRLIESAVNPPYSTVAATMYQLKLEGKLIAREKGGRYTYQLPPQREAAEGEASAQAAAAPSPLPLSSLRPVVRSIQVHDAALNGVEQETLVALRSIGYAATLDEIYRALTPRPTYVEVVRAVRRLMKQRLVVRIKHENRYLYRVAE